MTTIESPQPPAAFDPAFRRLQDIVSRDDARTLESNTIKDVWDAVKQIEHQLQQRRLLRGLRRIQPLLSGIEQYSSVMAVLCEGLCSHSVHMLFEACSCWHV